mmetsp:Transcript_24668/g.21897  ORF Transcript_24668/g.21897 Transcript_24668/m.21897 type:complete len:361 (+) Transcript_24668:8-1090(+)
MSTSSNRKQLIKQEKTIFPADFFTGNRISDPGHRHHLPKINITKEKAYHGSMNTHSPKKEAISDSTSAFSRENEVEDGVKLPNIERHSQPQKLELFKFPFQKQNQSMTDKQQKNNDFKGDSLNSGSQVDIDEYSPKVFIGPTFEVSSNRSQDCKINPRIKQKRISSSSLSYKPKIDNSMNKSNSMAKGLLHSRELENEGFDTDRTHRVNHSQFSTPVKYINYSLVKEQNIPNYPKLPVYESGSEEEENEKMLDFMSENAFEELCKLAEDPNSIPDIYIKNKESSDTFGFQKIENLEKDITDKKFISFDEVLRKEKEVKSISNTVKHKSKKAQKLLTTPFNLSSETPLKYCQKTAYFGHEN